MTEAGHGVQVVTVEDDHSYKLNEAELDKILLNDSIKDLPVALVSVAGAYRGGKSFLLNFFIRYLSAPLAARSDGSWLGEDSELTGFSWRGGTVRNTTGILIWSEPFLVRIPSGEKVAVILMDTQGTFDSTSSVRDCSTIFALSTLLSSTQIYNLSLIIKEDDLQELQLFTDFGKLMRDETGKAFQVLEFLVRDWSYDDEYDFGQEGGELYLAKKLEITAKQPPELQKLHQHILDSFEKVTCFLMPHPGFKVSKKKFKGAIKDIDPGFTNGIKELAPSIFSPENLNLKLLGGHPITCRELAVYFKSYMSIFNSGKIPTPRTFYETTRDAGLLMAYNDARNQFESNMQLACGTEAPSMPAVDVVELQASQVAAARATFKEKKLLGSHEEIDQRLTSLVEELNARQKEYIEINAAKTMRTVERGYAAYDRVIEAVTQSKQLCLHATDLQELNNIAIEAAKKAFDEKRRIKPDRRDADRDKFILELGSKYNAYRLLNEQNNNYMIFELETVYSDSMMAHCSKESKLTPKEFEKEHEKALATALDEFQLRRNRAHPYDMDTFKTKLERTINERFTQVNQINASQNRGQFQKAITIYKATVISLSELRNSCLHPDDLKKNHEDGMCKALKAFDINRSCSQGFDQFNNDQALLHSIFTGQYEPMVEINATANEYAVETAYTTFKKKFDDLTPWYYPIQAFFYNGAGRNYHDEALSVSVEDFFSKRRNRKYHETDSYLDELKSKCWTYWKKS